MNNPMTDHLMFQMDPRGNGGLMGSGRIADDLGDSPAIQAMRISDAASLRELQREWRFFTPAILFSQLPFDPILEWINLDPNSQVFQIPLDRPFFIGNLGPNTSQYVSTIYGCDKESWPSLRHYLSVLSFLDRDQKKSMYAFWHPIDIPDVLQMSKLAVLPSVLPMVRIAVIGYSDGEKCWGMFQGKAPLYTPRVTSIQATVTDHMLAFNALNDIPLDPRVPGHPAMQWDPATNRFFHPRGIDDQSFDSEPVRPASV